MPRIQLRSEQDAARMRGLAGPQARRALAHRPAMADAIGQLNAAVLASSLDPRLHELVRYRIALINGCARCKSYRAPQAKAAGVDEDLLAATAEWRAATVFADIERDALDYAERFCLDPASIADDLVDRLRAGLGDDGVLDLSVCVAKYLAIGRLISVLDLDQVCVVGSPALFGELTG